MRNSPITAWQPGWKGTASPLRGLRRSMAWRRICRVQDRIAQSLKTLRHVQGVLSLETIEAKPIFNGDQIRDLEEEEKNRLLRSAY